MNGGVLDTTTILKATKTSQMEGLCDYMKKSLFLHIAFNIVVVATVAVECCLVESLLC